MNKVFKTIFNKALGVWQAVSENAKGHGRAGVRSERRRGRTARAAATATFLLAAGAVHALPTGGNFIVGGGSITENVGHLLIEATSSGGDAIAGRSNPVVIEWGGFSIEIGETVEYRANGTPVGIWVNVDKSGVLSTLAGEIIVPNARTPWLLINPNGIEVQGTAKLPNTFIAVPGDLIEHMGGHQIVLNEAPIIIDPAATVDVVQASPGDDSIEFYVKTQTVRLPYQFDGHVTKVISDSPEQKLTIKLPNYEDGWDPYIPDDETGVLTGRIEFNDQSGGVEIVSENSLLFAWNESGSEVPRSGVKAYNTPLLEISAEGNVNIEEARIEIDNSDEQMNASIVIKGTPDEEGPGHYINTAFSEIKARSETGNSSVYIEGEYVDIFETDIEASARGDSSVTIKSLAELYVDGGGLASEILASGESATISVDAKGTVEINGASFDARGDESAIIDMVAGYTDMEAEDKVEIYFSEMRASSSNFYEVKIDSVNSFYTEDSHFSSSSTGRDSDSFTGIHLASDYVTLAGAELEAQGGWNSVVTVESRDDAEIFATNVNVGASPSDILFMPKTAQVNFLSGSYLYHMGGLVNINSEYGELVINSGFGTYLMDVQASLPTVLHSSEWPDMSEYYPDNSLDRYSKIFISSDFGDVELGSFWSGSEIGETFRASRIQISSPEKVFLGGQSRILSEDGMIQYDVDEMFFGENAETKAKEGHFVKNGAEYVDQPSGGEYDNVSKHYDDVGDGPLQEVEFIDYSVERGIIIQAKRVEVDGYLDAGALSWDEEPPPPNTPPTIEQPDPITIEKDVPYNGQINAYDDDGDPLTFTLDYPTSTMLVDGKPVVWEGSGTNTLTGRVDGEPVYTVVIQNDGTYTATYTGNDDQTQVAGQLLNFGVTVSDGQETASTTLQIDVALNEYTAPPVNQPPSIEQPDAVVLQKDVPHTDRVNATDSDGDPLTFTLTAPGGAMLVDGKPVVWEGSGTNTLTGRVDGEPVYTVVIQNDGTYTAIYTGNDDQTKVAG